MMMMMMMMMMTTYPCTVHSSNLSADAQGLLCLNCLESKGVDWRRCQGVGNCLVQEISSSGEQSELNHGCENKSIFKGLECLFCWLHQEFSFPLSNPSIGHACHISPFIACNLLCVEAGKEP
mmetsp:Transcript_144691/g.250485  ORF Transcript_144691/g.250485 Transcript_144691/m.250485 type:complete len:122 (-) Transcript_144691:573-938(-)